MRFLLALVLSATPTLAAPALRPTVVVSGDAVTLGDLVADAGPAAATAIFRAPDAGSHGTIQAWRVLEAARAYGIEQVDTRGVVEVRVERAARTVGDVEILDALAAEAMRRAGIGDRARLELRADGPIPTAVLDAAPESTLAIDRFAHDAASGRFDAAIVAVDPGGRRSRAVRVTGVAVELVDTVRLRRAVNRGEVVNAGDLQVERAPRGRIPSDAALPADAVAGMAARRALSEGSLVRAGDVERPRVVSRGDALTIVFEAANLVVTARGKANDNGAVGDTIEVQNAASRRTLQATITGPGRVAVRLPGQRRVADLTPQSR